MLALAGCASAPVRPAEPPAEAFAPEPPADFSPGAAWAFRHQRVEVVPGPPGNEGGYAFQVGHETIPDREFRARYRDLTGNTDLDEVVHEHAVKNNPKAIAVGAGALVLGAGGLTLAAVTSPHVCDHDPAGHTPPGCGKAVLGMTFLAAAAAVGTYVLGCELVKGAACITDGNIGVGGRPLDRAAAERYAARYDDTLARSIGPR